MSLKPFAFGIDFGGTSTKIGLVDRDGYICDRQIIDTQEVASPAEWIERIEKTLRALLTRNDTTLEELAGIGVGCPGFINHQIGMVLQLPNVPGWENIELGHELFERFHVPVFIDNDVNAMANGECSFGAGKYYQYAVCITLGTGVGGAILLDDKIYRGAHSLAGEIGHTSIEMDGVRSPMGIGGIEQYIGNQKIARRAKEAILAGQVSPILTLAGGNVDNITPKHIAEAAEQGDSLGKDIFDFVGKCLATSLSSIAYLIQPQVFIIGGGVSLSGAVLFDPLKKHLAERLHPTFLNQLDILPAELGNDAGMIGCAAMVFKESY